MDILGKSTKITGRTIFDGPGRDNDFWVTCTDCADAPAYSGATRLGHQNAGNTGFLGDLNFQSALQLAVELRNSENIFVCGHSECRVIGSILENERRLDFLDTWTAPIARLAARNNSLLAELDGADRSAALAKLNVLSQVLNIGDSVTVREKWKQGAKLKLWAVYFDSRADSLMDLDFSVESIEQLNLRRNIFSRKLDEARKLDFFRVQYGFSA
ncbi:MAG: hypothetical protein JSS81_03495 [Acidobacteria bacterium]|nr:hypothetical protein [Acidobacteriota bacterium]